MKGGNLDMSNDRDAVNSDHQVGLMYEQSQNIAVDSLDQQKNEDFVEELLLSSSLFQPPGDVVDLFSAFSEPLSIIPPGPVPHSGGLTCFGIDCEEASSSHQTFDKDYNVESFRYPLNKRLRRSLIHPVTLCHDQVDKMSWEDRRVSLVTTNISFVDGHIINLQQYSNPMEQRVYEEHHGITHYDTTVTVAVRGPNEASSHSAVDNRTIRLIAFFHQRRRAKISEGIKVLEESTPQFGKALSQSRLGGEPIHHPFVHLEGFGHYMVHQQKPSEPLEEVIGHLLDSNMPLATELLESKGLELLPMSSADRIVKASAAKVI
ncbi:hypothetical protein Taro_022447 [Colocasia esculenta]|uniref:Uncharacterized protein n=1 Tax=Colocasia esculenta TaxID=4460 RepID=A0A843V1W7_COLES|nr:hypothetical protein [Colocasia esculenta]